MVSLLVNTIGDFLKSSRGHYYSFIKSNRFEARSNLAKTSDDYR
jgi:hypothetical protein